MITLTCSVSTALDEAATALTRMKSEKQTYEAFLRGANQAPSPLSVAAPNSPQPQPAVSQPSCPPTPNVALATSISGGSAKGGGPGGGGGTAGGGGGKLPTQQKGVQQPPPQQQQQQPVQNHPPLDGVQTVQKLLTQGTKCKGQKSKTHCVLCTTRINCKHYQLWKVEHYSPPVKVGTISQKGWHALMMHMYHASCIQYTPHVHLHALKFGVLVVAVQMSVRMSRR